MALLKDFKYVAMYLRISQEKKSENFETLSNHRRLLTDFANKNGYSYKAYEEVLSGGASELEQRPQLQKLLNELEQFDAILVVELSRLSRNGLISETVLQFCKDYDKPIITPDKIYDLANNDNDVLTFRFGSLIASQEHALIGKRSKYNKIQMARAGFHISGSAPFGYVRNSTTKKLEINEEEAKTVRYIFTLHSQGLGSFKIREMLNAEGYKSSTGRPFNLPSIKRIIQNPVYKGWTVFTDRKK
ncbi:recombinase family protein [Halalkalibacter okhensis]|uniref:recombinase family protein n=1 Tax=Halalkalibacter okhensis TaxID=333138 RepID=UPI000AF409DA|nr:recombinase family protein [Halalkalibacter okhensis]